MYKSWLIIDGPPQLTDRDVGLSRTFTLNDEHRPVRLDIVITHVGITPVDRICSFAGTAHIDNHHVSLLGTYNKHDHTGTCITNPAVS